MKPSRFQLFPGHLAEFTVCAGWLLLLARPALGDPRFLPLALSLGLILLFLRPLQDDALATLGPAVLALLGFVVLSSAWSLQPGISLQASALLFLAAVLFLVVRGLEPGSRGRIVNVLLAAGTLSALYGCAQWTWGFDRIQAHLRDFPQADYEALRGAAGIKRAFGFLITPGAQAALMLLLLPMAWAKAREGRGTVRWIYGTAGVSLLVGLMAAQSAGAWVALAGGFVLAGGVSKNTALRAWAIRGSMFALALMGALVAYRGWGHWSHASLDNRVILWDRVLQLGLRHWVGGVGAGCFEAGYWAAGFPIEGGARFSHNLPLQAFAELGLPGLVLAVWAAQSLFRRVGKGWATPAGLGVLSVCLYSLLDLPFVMPEILAATAILAGTLTLERTEWKIKLPVLRADRMEWILLGVLAVYGLNPPFRPWNLALGACVLLSVTAFRRSSVESVHAWVALTGIYLIGRSLLGPSSLGSAWFLTAAALALVFLLYLRSQPDPGAALLRFSRVGLVWMLFEWAHFVKDPNLYSLGFFAQPKHLASFLAVLALLELNAAKKTAKNWVSISVSLLTLAAFRATGALAGLMAGLWVFWKNLKPGKSRKFYGFLAMGMGATFLFFLGWRFVGNHQSTPWGRVQMWKAAGQIWLDQWLFGAGPGSYGGMFHQFQVPQVGKVSRYLMDPQHAHNEWLEGLASFGLLGLVLFGGSVWVVTRKPLRVETRAVIAATGLNAFFDFTWHTPVLAWQALGASAGPATRPKPQTSWLNAGAALALGLGIWGSAACVPSMLRTAEADQAAGQFPEALREYQAAERLAPWDHRVILDRALYLESLFLATDDPAWRTRSEDAFDRVQELEQTDGTVSLVRARRDAARLGHLPLEEVSAQGYQSFQRARGDQPFSAQVLREEGDFLQKVGRKPEALACYRSALSFEPNDAPTEVALGDLADNLKLKPEALQAYQRALGILDQWKGEEVAPAERDMVTLPPEVLARVRKAAAP